MKSILSVFHPISKILCVWGINHLPVSFQSWILHFVMNICSWFKLKWTRSFLPEKMRWVIESRVNICRCESRVFTDNSQMLSSFGVVFSAHLQRDSGWFAAEVNRFIWMFHHSWWVAFIIKYPCGGQEGFGFSCSFGFGRRRCSYHHLHEDEWVFVELS